MSSLMPLVVTTWFHLAMPYFIKKIFHVVQLYKSCIPSQQKSILLLSNQYINYRRNFMSLINRLFILFIITTSTIQPEFILYKKNADKIAPLNYKAMSDDEKTKLIELYENTIVRYQWPTVLRYYDKFTDQEKQDYEHACSVTKGLSDFIAKKVATLSNNQYGSVWIPTTTFELKTLSYCVTHMTKEIVDEKFQHLKAEEIPAAFQSFCLKDYLFNIFDELLTTYRKKDSFVTQYSGNEQFVEKFIKTIVPNLTNNTSFGQNLNIITTNPTPMDFSIYESAWLNIIKKYLQAEEETLINNQFTLLRGTNGYTTNQDNTPDHKEKIDKHDYIDFKLGSLRGISYGYYLFAGTVFERSCDENAENPNTKELWGARALDYIVHSEIGYYVALNIKDFQTLQEIFSLPDLSSFEGLFGYGEEFHPRLKLNTNNLSEQQKNIRAQMLAQLLKDAKFLQLKKTRDSEILADDILLQQAEILYGQKQGRFKIQHEEELDFYKTFIIPLIKSGKPLPPIVTPYFKYFNAQDLQQLTKSQLESLTPDQIESLTPDQISSLTLTQLQQLQPDQLQILMTPAKIGYLTTDIFDAQIISTLTKDQLESISLKQLEDFGSEKLKLFTHNQLIILASPYHISQLSIYTLLSFPISSFTQSQTQAINIPKLKTYQYTYFYANTLQRINVKDLSLEQVQLLDTDIKYLSEVQINNLPADAIQILPTNILALPLYNEELSMSLMDYTNFTRSHAQLSQDIEHITNEINTTQDSNKKEDLNNRKKQMLLYEQHLSQIITTRQAFIKQHKRYVINCVDIAKLSAQQIDSIDALLAQKMNDDNLSQFTLLQFKKIIDLPNQDIFRECINTQNRQTAFLSPDKICLLRDEQLKEVNHGWLTKEQIQALDTCKKA